MSGFGFSEEQEMFRRAVREFTQKELVPGAKEREKRGDYPRELVKRVAQAELLNLFPPPEYGGQGASFVTTAIAVEELARADLTSGLLPTLPVITTLALQQGSEELRQKWLPGMCTGDYMSCLAITEPEIGSDVASMRATAKREGDYYILNGEKSCITLATYADVAMTPVKTDPKAGARGVTFFMVPLDLPGISRSFLPHLGFRTAGTASIFMDNARVPADHRVGEEGQGFYVVMNQFDVLRVYLVINALGETQASIEDAINYAKARIAFGRPIAKFEAVSFKIAEITTYVEAARLLCYRSLWLADQNLPHTKEAAMAKWFAAEAAVKACHDALIIHGHYGYSDEYSVEQRLRDVIGWEIADGTADIMKMIIARELMGREFLPY